MSRLLSALRGLISELDPPASPALRPGGPSGLGPEDNRQPAPAPPLTSPGPPMSRSRARGFSGLLTAALLAGCAASGPEPPPAWNSLAAAIPGLMANRRVPGLAVATIRNGTLAAVRGYGWADLGAERPVTGQTRFQVATLSRPLAAWVAMTHVEAGRLRLNASVSRTPSELPGSQDSKAARTVTLRQILSHPVERARPGDFDWPRTQGQGDPDSGYRQLERLVAQAGGQDFAAQGNTLMQRLGMVESRFGPVPADAALAYDRNGAPLPAHRSTAPATAELWSTAADLGRFVAALLPGPRGESPGRGVLRPNTLAAMLTPVEGSAHDLLFQGSQWGLGFGLKRLDSGLWLVFHPGDSSRGWHGLIAALPDRRTGLAVLTNGENGRELGLEVFCRWLREQAAGMLPECAGQDGPPPSSSAAVRRVSPPSIR